MMRFLLGALFGLFASAALACNSISVDGTNTVNDPTNSTTHSLALTTTGSADLILAFMITNNGTGAAVTNMSSTHTSGWTKRESIAFSSAPVNVLDYWTGTASAVLSAESITFTLGANSGGRMVLVGINGQNSSTPFDGNGSIPGTNTTTGTTSISTTISTNNACDMLIGLFRSSATLSTVSRPSGFVQVAGASSGSTDFSTDTVSATLSSVTETFSNATSGNLALIVDAIQISTGVAPTCPVGLAAQGAGC